MSTYLYTMELNTTFARFLVEDKVLVVNYKEGLHITYDIAKQIVRDRLTFTKGRKMAVIIKSHGVVSIDKPAREFLASENGTVGLLATAIIVDSDYTRLLGNFFLFVNKTKIPVRIFSDIPKSVKWLQKYII